MGASVSRPGDSENVVRSACFSPKMMKADEKCYDNFQDFRSDQKYVFLAQIGLKFWDQAFLDLEIQKVNSVWPDFSKTLKRGLNHTLLLLLTYIYNILI